MDKINKELCILLIKKYVKTNESKYLISLKMEIMHTLQNKYFEEYNSDYYKEDGKPETIDVIKSSLEGNFKFFLIGNMIKYIKRYGLKDKENKHYDLIKAKNYLNYLLKEEFPQKCNTYKIFTK